MFPRGPSLESKLHVPAKTIVGVKASCCLILCITSYCFSPTESTSGIYVVPSSLNKQESLQTLCGDFWYARIFIPHPMFIIRMAQHWEYLKKNLEDDVKMGFRWNQNNIWLGMGKQGWLFSWWSTNTRLHGQRMQLGITQAFRNRLGKHAGSGPSQHWSCLGAEGWCRWILEIFPRLPCWERHLQQQRLPAPFQPWPVGSCLQRKQKHDLMATEMLVELFS